MSRAPRRRRTSSQPPAGRRPGSKRATLRAMETPRVQTATLARFSCLPRRRMSIPPRWRYPAHRGRIPLPSTQKWQVQTGIKGNDTKPDAGLRITSQPVDLPGARALAQFAEQTDSQLTPGYTGAVHTLPNVTSAPSAELGLPPASATQYQTAQYTPSAQEAATGAYSAPRQTTAPQAVPEQKTLAANASAANSAKQEIQEGCQAATVTSATCSGQRSRRAEPRSDAGNGSACGFAVYQRDRA